MWMHVSRVCRSLWVRRPLLLAIAVLLIDCLVIAAFAVKLPQAVLVDNAIDIWFDQTDPTIPVFEREKATFEGGTWLLASVWATDAAPETLDGLSDDLTDALGRVDGVTNVLSPHAIDVLQTDGEGLYFDRLPEELHWDERWRTLIEHPAAGNLLVHPEHPEILTFVIKEAMDTGQSDAARQRLVAEIRRVLHGEPRIERATLVGTSVINAEMNRLSWQDFLILIPTSSVVILLLIVLMIRTHWRFGLGVVLAGGMATLAVCGAMLALETPFNMLTIALPGVVFTLSVASCLHVLQHYVTQKASGDRGWHTTQRLLRPIVVSHVTTALGFGLMIVVPVIPVETMAWFGAAGVLWAGVHSAFVAPQLFALLGPAESHPPAVLFRGTARIAAAAQTLAARFPRWQRRRGGVALVLLAAVALLIVLISTLRVDSTYLNMISEDETMRRDYATLEDVGLPSAQLSLLVTRPSKDALVGTDLNDALTAAAARIEALEPVRKVIGPPAIYREVAAQLADDRPLERFSADPFAVTDAYIFALTGGNQEVVHYVEDSLEQYRFVVLVEYLGNAALRALIDEDIQRILDDTLGRVEGATVDVSGLSVLWSNLDQAILRGQLVSILTIGLVCFGVFYLSTRRLRVSVVATAVNFLPMAAIAALMAATGMKLDLAAIFVLGLTLGIAIDDTSFFVHHYCDGESSASADGRGGIDAALKATVPPMLATSLVIAIGFSVLLLSAFIPMRVFGAFTALGVLFAALFDCFILPLLLTVYVNEPETLPCSKTIPADAAPAPVATPAPGARVA